MTIPASDQKASVAAAQWRPASALPGAGAGAGATNCISGWPSGPDVD